MPDDEIAPSVTTEEVAEEETGGSRWPKIFLFAAITSVIALTVLVLWGGREELRTVKPGHPAPDFTFRDLSHQQVSLSDYKGKVVLLNFWSITCPPCIEEIPYLERLQQMMKDNEDFHLLTVVTNRGETENEVRPFMEKKGLTFHALIDSKKVAWRRYKLTGWPETFLLDREGTIIEKFVGPRKWDSKEFLDKFNKLIGSEE